MKTTIPPGYELIRIPGTLLEYLRAIDRGDDEEDDEAPAVVVVPPPLAIVPPQPQQRDRWAWLELR